MADIIKFILAGLLLVAGLVGFYYYSDLPLVARVGMVLGGLIAGVLVGLMSAPGQRFAVFVRESYVEMQKVVWPTGKESVQTTAAVFGFVLIMALFLWGVDAIVESVLYKYLLGWKS